MDRRGTSLLLIPLLAAFAFFSPIGSRKPANESSRSSSPVTATKPKAPAPKGEQWHGGRDAVQKFFARGNAPAKNRTAAGIDDPRQRAELKFLIATVPDPIDSGLALSFDRYVGAVQAATQSAGYVLADFDLPWDDCLDGPKSHDRESSGEFQISLNPGTGSEGALISSEDKCSARRFADTPGFLLLSGYSGDDKSTINLLLLYLVGESPTTGIQKTAFRAALDEVGSFYSQLAQAGSTQQSGAIALASSRPLTLSISAPTFSGSAQSLDLALSAWLDTFPNGENAPSIKMISGSATGIAWPPEPESLSNLQCKCDFYDTWNFYHMRGSRSTLGETLSSQSSRTFSFQSMENTDDASKRVFFDYLCQQQTGIGEKRVKVALLYEGNTAYGQGAAGTNSGTEHCESITGLPYPLHISQLRAASEKLRRERQATSTQPQLQSNRLPLSDALEDTGRRRDIESFSPASPVSSEQILANTLSTISEQGYKYVGIFATDVRDTIFLAQEVRQHAPNTVLFTFNSDLILLHPEINSAVRGMLVVSSYPLNSSNQIWSLPSSGTRLQFPDDASEGTYNAVLALLGADQNMLELSLPFLPASSPKTSAPVWISVVGRKRLWPVQAEEVDTRGYTYALKPSDGEKNNSSQLWRGIYSESTLILITGFALFSIVFSLPLIQRFGSQSVFPIGPRRENFLFSLATWKWLDRVMAPAISEEHRRRGELFLLAAAASISGVLLVALTALAVPALVVMFRLRVRPFSLSGQTLVGSACTIVCVLSAAMLLLGIAAVFLELRSRREGWTFGRPVTFKVSAWAPITLLSALITALAVLVSCAWFYYGFREQSFRSALLYSFRSLDLTSGVSPLAPLFLISLSSFVWAVISFHRIRMIEGFESKKGFLRFSPITFPEISELENKIRFYLQCPARDLPGAGAILAFTIAAAVFCIVRFVRSIEHASVYWLLWLSYFSAILALTLGVLRFFWVWKQTKILLQHVAYTPMRIASKRFRSNLRSWPKIDLASPAPSLAPLALAVEQLQTIVRRSRRVLAQTSPGASFHVKAVAAGTEIEAAASTQAMALQLSDADRDTLTRLLDPRVEAGVVRAEGSLANARMADAGDNWREVLLNQYECQQEITCIATRVSQALERDWWQELRPARKQTDDTISDPESVFELAEAFVAGRISHFLAHVFPQLEMLIYAPVAGILLLLFAISSYPFQPHSLLLWFNSAIILGFVAVALWTFAQMNRDPILSGFNGTTPGKITWDKQFILRVVLYGVVPILALLGAQFPDTVGQIISYIAPAESMHP